MVGIRAPPRDRQRNKAATSRLRVASSNIVLEILAKFGERLDSHTARVEGSDSSSSMSQTSKPGRDGDVDERLNDYSTINIWPDKELGKHPSSLLDIELVPISHL